MRVAAFLLIFCALAMNAHAQEDFTPEQKKAIEAIVAVAVEQALAKEREKMQHSIVEQNPVSSSPQALDAPKIASSQDSKEKDIKEEPLERSPLEDKNSFVPIDRPLARPTPTFQIDLKQDGAKASFLIGNFFDGSYKQQPSAPSTSSKVRTTSQSWSFSLSAPIDDEENSRANFTSVDGFSPGLNGAFTYAWHKTNSVFLKTIDTNPEWIALCKKLLNRDVEGCPLSAVQKAVESDAEAAAALRSFNKNNLGSSTSFATTLKANRAKFDYFNSNLQAVSQRELEWSAGASFYFTPPSRLHMFGVGIDLVNKFEAGKSVVFCPPSNTTPVICQQGALSAPERENHTLLWGEYRSDILGFPYSLKIAHDLESSANAIDLPIYLIRKTDGPFSGGLRLGWTKADDFQVGFFVSTPFLLSPPK